MMFLVGKDWDNNQAEIVIFHNIYKICAKILDEAGDDDYYVTQGKLSNGKILVGVGYGKIDKPFRKLRNLLNNINL